MDTTFGRKLLWILVMVVSISAITRCDSDFELSTASTTTMMMTDETDSSTMTEIMSSVTRSEPTTMTIIEEMTTSGGPPATGDATSVTLLALLSTAILMMHRIQLHVFI